MTVGSVVGRFWRFGLLGLVAIMVLPWWLYGSLLGARYRIDQQSGKVVIDYSDTAPKPRSFTLRRTQVQNPTDLLRCDTPGSKPRLRIQHYHYPFPEFDRGSYLDRRFGELLLAARGAHNTEPADRYPRPSETNPAFPFFFEEARKLFNSWPATAEQRKEELQRLERILSSLKPRDSCALALMACLQARNRADDRARKLWESAGSGIPEYQTEVGAQPPDHASRVTELLRLPLVTSYLRCGNLKEATAQFKRVDAAYKRDPSVLLREDLWKCGAYLCLLEGQEREARERLKKIPGWKWTASDVNLDSLIKPRFALNTPHVDVALQHTDLATHVVTTSSNHLWHADHRAPEFGTCLEIQDGEPGKQWNAEVQGDPAAASSIIHFNGWESRQNPGEASLTGALGSRGSDRHPVSGSFKETYTLQTGPVSTDEEWHLHREVRHFDTELWWDVTERSPMEFRLRFLRDFYPIDLLSPANSRPESTPRPLDVAEFKEWGWRDGSIKVRWPARGSVSPVSSPGAKRRLGPLQRAAFRIRWERADSVLFRVGHLVLAPLMFCVIRLCLLLACLAIGRYLERASQPPKGSASPGQPATEHSSNGGPSNVWEGFACSLHPAHILVVVGIILAVIPTCLMLKDPPGMGPTLLIGGAIALVVLEWAIRALDVHIRDHLGLVNEIPENIKEPNRDYLNLLALLSVVQVPMLLYAMTHLCRVFMHPQEGWWEIALALFCIVIAMGLCLRTVWKSVAAGWFRRFVWAGFFIGLGFSLYRWGHPVGLDPIPFADGHHEFGTVAVPGRFSCQWATRAARTGAAGWLSPGPRVRGSSGPLTAGAG